MAGKALNFFPGHPALIALQERCKDSDIAVSMEAMQPSVQVTRKSTWHSWKKSQKKRASKTQKICSTKPSTTTTTKMQHSPSTNFKAPLKWWLHNKTFCEKSKSAA